MVVLGFYARQQNASHVLAIVEVSVRLSVRPSVTLRYCVKTRQAIYIGSRNLHCGLRQGL